MDLRVHREISHWFLYLKQVNKTYGHYNARNSYTGTGGRDLVNEFSYRDASQLKLFLLCVIERNCELAKIGGELDEKSYGIGLKKNSPYTNQINK